MRHSGYVKHTVVFSTMVTSDTGYIKNTVTLDPMLTSDT